MKTMVKMCNSEYWKCDQMCQVILKLFEVRVNDKYKYISSTNEMCFCRIISSIRAINFYYVCTRYSYCTLETL